MQVGYEKLLFSTSIPFHRVLSTPPLLVVINTASPDHGKLVTLIAGSSRRRSLLISGDGQRNVYNKMPRRYAEDNRTTLIVLSGKSEAE